MYIFDIKKMFLKIAVELPKSSSSKEKHQSLLHAIGGGWYVNKLCQKLPPLNKRIISNNSQEEKDIIKRKLHKASQD